eukprot:48481_1
MITATTPIKDNILLGGTINTQFEPAQSPFDEKSSIDLFSEDTFNKLPFGGKGTYTSSFELVRTEKEKAKALGVSGKMNLTYGPVTGDANVKFAMNNTNGTFGLSVMYSASHEGQKRLYDMKALNALKLNDHVSDAIKGTKGIPLTFDEFTQKYGRYVVIGYEYGGSILFDMQYSTKSSQDKKSVIGGLHLAYGKCGFQISGQVKGNYSQKDINKSFNITTSISINPSTIDPNETKLLASFDTLQNASTTSTTDLSSLKDQIDAAVYSILNPNPPTNVDISLNKSNAILLPIQSIPCVSYAFSESELKQAEYITGFFGYINPLYLDLKSKLQNINMIANNWTNPPIIVEQYGSKIDKLLQNIEAVTTVQDIYETAKKYSQYLKTSNNQFNNENINNIIQDSKSLQSATNTLA